MSMEDYNFRMARQAWGEQQKQPGLYKEVKEMYGATVGGDSRVTPRQPVISEFDHLMNDLDRLGEHMQRLESKLSPILADVPPPPEGDVGRGRDGHSKLSGMLYHAWLKVDALNTQVTALIDRTEV
jgi:hypothetical protein